MLKIIQLVKYTGKSTSFEKAFLLVWHISVVNVEHGWQPIVGDCFIVNWQNLHNEVTSRIICDM